VLGVQGSYSHLVSPSTSSGQASIQIAKQFTQDEPGFVNLTKLIRRIVVVVVVVGEGKEVLS